MKKLCLLSLVCILLLAACRKERAYELTVNANGTVVPERTINDYGIYYHNALNSATDALRMSSLSEIPQRKAEAYRAYRRSLAWDMGIMESNVDLLISSMGFSSGFTETDMEQRFISLYNKTDSFMLKDAQYRNVLKMVTDAVMNSATANELYRRLDRIDSLYRDRPYAMALHTVTRICREAVYYWPLHFYDWQYFRSHLEVLPLNTKVKQVLNISVRGALAGSIYGSLLPGVGEENGACIGASYAAAAVALEEANNVSNIKI